MKTAVFSTKTYDRTFLEAANTRHEHQLEYFEPRLTQTTCVLAAGFSAVCVFVNDQLDAPVLTALAQQGVQLIALRCAGFNHVDLAQAHKLGLTVTRVPAYSPHAVAEHTVGLILALNRHLHRAYARVREGNFSLEGLLGFDLYQRCVGVVGTGKIGAVVAQIMRGFGCRVLAYDPCPHAACQALGVQYVSLAELFAASDVITLHVPLTPETHYLINAQALRQMKPGVMLINTSRGALIDTRAAITALKSGKIGHLGLDVYEEEGELFFEDLSNRMIHDDVFTRLLTFPNVIITGHQGFFTAEALTNIADITLANITAFERGHGTLHEVSVEKLA